MKAGPCGTVFSAWEACVDEHRDGGADAFVESCMAQTRGLKECMEANPEYYGPLLEGEGGDEGEAAAEGGEPEAEEAVPPPADKAEEAVPKQQAEEAAPAAAAKAAPHRH
jgi:hypothetical protein